MAFLKMRSSILLTLCIVLCVSLVHHQAEAGSGLRLKKLIKYGLIANAFTGKKILFPLPLPVPIPVFQENIHHIPYPVNHHTHTDIGYGYKQGGQYGYGGGHGGEFGGEFGGGLGYGIHGGAW